MQLYVYALKYSRRIWQTDKIFCPTSLTNNEVAPLGQPRFFLHLHSCVLRQNHIMLADKLTHINQRIAHPTQRGVDTHTCLVGNLLKTHT